MQRYQYISIDSILAKYQRDFRGVGIVEDDAIEWIAEALGYMKMANVSEEAVHFAEVKNYQVDLPQGLHYIINIARNTRIDEDPNSCNVGNILQELEPENSEPQEGLSDNCVNCDDEKAWLKTAVPVDCHGNIIGDYEVAYYRPFFNLQYEYGMFRHSTYYQRDWQPVRLTNHSFFNSLVCREKEFNQLYTSAEDEYTIVQDKLRFSFKEGFVAISYLRNPIDIETGYPMIPDDESARAAITYYLGWKVKERECWNHREGACQLAEKAEMKWLKYIKQFRNKTKMPYGVDQYENLRQGSMYVLPNNKRYYGFFGNLNRAETTRFRNPDRRNQRRNIRRGV